MIVCHVSYSHSRNHHKIISLGAVPPEGARIEFSDGVVIIVKQVTYCEGGKIEIHGEYP